MIYEKYIYKLIFRVCGKRRKMFLIENIFRENDFLENILQQKPFYVEVNGALDTIF